MSFTVGLRGVDITVAHIQYLASKTQEAAQDGSTHVAGTKDQMEDMRAFVGKRKPEFKGR